LPDSDLPPPDEPILRPPPLRVEIRILDDGRVVFGDLPPELAEVAALLAGEPDPSGA
jgi:hypothetical protein